MFLSFAGVFVAGYLSISDVLNLEVPCGPTHACDFVQHSAYGSWFGIPVAVFGFAGYLVLAILSVVRSFSKPETQKLTTYVALLVSGIGTIVSFYLIFISLTELNATCMWCISSATIMTLCFLAHGVLVQQDEPVQPSRGMEMGYVIALTVLMLGGISLRATNLNTAAFVSSASTKKLPKSATIEFLVPKDAHFLGPANAPLVIIEFGDLMCPHCKKSYDEMKKVVDASQGKVKFVFRHFPLYNLPGHEMAQSAATVAEICADKGKFWNYIDAIFGSADPDKLTKDDLKSLAVGVGVDAADLDRRLQDDNDPAYTRVKNDFATGTTLNIDSTPTFAYALAGKAPNVATAPTLKAELSEAPYSQYVKGL
jgi:protein-disulfide isomerase/uncharacterized membrane protein